MTFRLIFGLGWSLLSGLAGGWMVLAPWAVGGQGGGDWTTATKNELGAGVGLIALAVIGIVVVVAQIGAALRDAGVITPARTAGATGTTASSPEMERALIALAQALAEDLDAQRPAAPAGRREPS